MSTTLKFLAVALIALLVSSAATTAAVIITAQEVGADVVFNATGSINLSALTFNTAVNCSPTRTSAGTDQSSSTPGVPVAGAGTGSGDSAGGLACDGNGCTGAVSASGNAVA